MSWAPPATPSGLVLSVAEEQQLFRIMARLDFDDIPPGAPIAGLMRQLRDRANLRDVIALNAARR